MTINELLELARKIIDSQANDEQLSNLIASYTNEFDTWAAGQLELFSGQAKIEDLERSELAELMQLHGAVITRAQMLLGKTSNELKTLRARGKGVIKYLDHFPSRVSTVEGKKG